MTMGPSVDFRDRSVLVMSQDARQVEFMQNNLRQLGANNLVMVNTLSEAQQYITANEVHILLINHEGETGTSARQWVETMQREQQIPRHVVVAYMVDAAEASHSLVIELLEAEPDDVLLIDPHDVTGLRHKLLVMCQHHDEFHMVHDLMDAGMWTHALLLASKQTDVTSHPAYHTKLTMDVLTRLGQPEKARGVGQSLLARGANLAVYHRMGQLYLADQQVDAACSILTEAQTAFPEAAGIKAQLARAIFLSGNGQAALSMLERCLLEKPCSMDVLRARGELLMAMKDWGAACYAWYDVVALAAKGEFVRLSDYQMLAQSTRRALKDLAPDQQRALLHAVEKILSKGIKASSQRVHMRLETALIGCLVLRQRDQLERAQRTYRQIIERLKNKGSIHTTTRTSLLETGWRCGVFSAQQTIIP